MASINPSLERLASFMAVLLAYIGMFAGVLAKVAERKVTPRVPLSTSRRYLPVFESPLALWLSSIITMLFCAILRKNRILSLSFFCLNWLYVAIITLHVSGISPTVTHLAVSGNDSPLYRMLPLASLIWVYLLFPFTMNGISCLRLLSFSAALTSSS